MKPQTYSPGIIKHNVLPLTALVLFVVSIAAFAYAETPDSQTWTCYRVPNSSNCAVETPPGGSAAGIMVPLANGTSVPVVKLPSSTFQVTTARSQTPILLMPVAFFATLVMFFAYANRRVDR